MSKEKTINGVTYILIKKTEYQKGLDCDRCDAHKTTACLKLKECITSDKDHIKGIRSKYWEVKK